MKTLANAAVAALLALGLAACTANEPEAVAPQADIVDTAVAANDFNTLVAAVQAAGLVETLKGEGPFTVFAPTDDAFAALPAGTVDNLLKPENRDTLVAVLTYHVVPGKVMSGDIAGQTLSAVTVQGTPLDIDATSGVMVNNANVIAADVEASNGVIHVIDMVLLP
ncbi:MAG: fasciclin domain-containing protein [Pseudomonadota bacterium]